MFSLVLYDRSDPIADLLESAAVGIETGAGAQRALIRDDTDRVVGSYDTHARTPFMGTAQGFYVEMPSGLGQYENAVWLRDIALRLRQGDIDGDFETRLGRGFFGFVAHGAPRACARCSHAGDMTYGPRVWYCPACGHPHDATLSRVVESAPPPPAAPTAQPQVAQHRYAPTAPARTPGHESCGGGICYPEYNGFQKTPCQWVND